MVKANVSFIALIFITVTALAQKPEMLPRSSPEAEGVSSQGIIDFLEAAGKSKHELHSFMFLRHGKVIAEGWWKPYRPDLKHSMYSVSKSFTSTAIGFAAIENKLSVHDKVISFFPNELPDTVSPYLSELTVKDLLTMSTGHDPDPTGNTKGSKDTWVKTFLSTQLVYKPGTKFTYNTLATYVLSAIVQKQTGQTLMDYLTPRLFNPLGINGIDWEVSPQGINIGGYGLRLKTEDMAKFGQLYLKKGAWNNKQLLTKEWVNEATTSKIEQNPVWVSTQSKKDSSDWLQGYGYQFWRCRNNAFRADGLAGQFIIVLPDQDAVIVLTSEAPDMQGEINLVWKYLLPAMHKNKLPDNQTTVTVLKQKLSSLALPIPAKVVASSAVPGLSGKSFEIAPNAKQIKNISFQFKADTCVALIKTDTASYKLNFGRGTWINGETMKTGPYFMANLIGLLPFKVAGSFSWKEGNVLELVLRYIETPHTETFSCRFDENRVSVDIKNSNQSNNNLVLEGKVEIEL